MSELPENEDWRVRKELNLMGADPDIMWRPMDTLSGGERTKLMLANLFASDGIYPLIDEPTNHLDRQGREAVADYLSTKDGFILFNWAYDTHNVIVRNCSLNTSCQNFRLGGKNVLIENCRLWGPGEYPHRVSGRHNTLFAFIYYALRYDRVDVDSENWLVRNCTMENLDCLFDYRYGAEFTHDARPLRDVTFENVTMTGFLKPAVFNPVPGNPLTVTMRNVTMSRREEAETERMFLTSPDVTLILENAKIDGLNA